MLVKEGIHLPRMEELQMAPLIEAKRLTRAPEGVDAEDTRRLWLESRRNGIGASDIPAIMGTANPKWGSPYALWNEKMGFLPIDTEELEHQTFGHLMEDTATRAFELRCNRGQMMDPDGAGIRHAAHPWNVASIDRILCLELTEGMDFEGIVTTCPLWIPVEIKNVSEYKSDKWGSVEIPEMYYDQVQDQLEVTGRPCSLLLAVLGGNRMKVYTVFRDVIRAGEIMREAEAFWESIQNGDCPEPDDTEATEEALKLLFNKTDGSAIPMTGEMLKWCQELESAKETIESMEAKVMLNKNLIRREMGEAKMAKHPLFSISYGTQTRQAVDKEKAEKDDELQTTKERVKVLESKYKQPVTIRVLKVTASGKKD